jgi:DNA-binding response OmpR family regulator
MRILLVEDEIHVRLALARPLSAWGYRVIEAASVVDASVLLRDELVDLAIVDVNLPDGTGWEVLQVIRDQVSGDNDIPTIVVSAIAPSTERLRQFRPFGVLLKPFPIESLRQLVSRAAENANVAKGKSLNA